MTFITIKSSLKKGSLYLFNLPLLVIRNTGSSTDDLYERLTKIFIEFDDGTNKELDLDLSEVDWSNTNIKSYIRQVYENYDGEIIAEYTLRG
jgi:hypothetical protein